MGKYDNTFDRFSSIEMGEIFNTTHLQFYGLTLQQNPRALLKINQLLNIINIERIIEIGAGDGGFSYLFSLWAKIKNKEFYS